MAHASIDTATATALQVLVVDDSQALRTRVRSALERAGLIVVGEAADGTQALIQAATHHPDVVLMDLRMPRMDGIQATRILRRQQPDSRTALPRGSARSSWSPPCEGSAMPKTQPDHTLPAGTVEPVLAPSRRRHH